MSGFLGAALSGIGNLAGAFNHPAGFALGVGGKVPVSLAGIPFGGFEIPEKVSFGGEQQTTVHKFPGGARTIDTMGPDDRDIEWSGHFLGGDAVARALQFDTLRRAGAQIPMVVGQLSRNVVIRHFHAEYENPAHVPYSVCCIVVSPPAKATTTLKGDTQTDLNSATSFSNIAATIQKVTRVAGAVVNAVEFPSLAGISTALGDAGTLIPGSSSFSGLQAAVTNAQGELATFQGLANTAIAAGNATTPAGILSLVASSGNLANAFAAGAFINRMAMNLKNTSS